MNHAVSPTICFLNLGDFSERLGGRQVGSGRIRRGTRGINNPREVSLVADGGDRFSRDRFELSLLSVKFRYTACKS